MNKEKEAVVEVVETILTNWGHDDHNVTYNINSSIVFLFRATFHDSDLLWMCGI